MKKTHWWLLMPLVLTLTGCGNGAAPAKNSSDQPAASASSQSQQSRHKVSQSTQASTTSQSTSSAPQPEARLTTLRTAARQLVPGMPFPTTYTPASGQALNVVATGDAANATLFLSEGRAQAFNAAGLPTTDAPLAIQKTTTTSDAQIDPQAVQADLPTVALGDGLVGTQEGAAGSSYITWQEGRWVITVQAANINGEDSLPLAKQAVALFAQQMLPIPATQGAIHLRVSAGTDRINTVTWRSGDAVYQVSGQDAMATIQLAVTLH
ncbi:hypothetical protein [Lacticaseibacillus daqingensis]|uniref:hypothetical protein n=1 Tax=Lacticaseibacillus daqingensis TaxID=2486014 RepID=UPI000F78C006|nr:hypothetical protein [Lacticaseibacillus daqingensis]